MPGDRSRSKPSRVSGLATLWRREAWSVIFQFSLFCALPFAPLGPNRCSLCWSETRG